MANATAGVHSFATDWTGGYTLKEQIDVSVVQDYFPMSMVGIGANGFLVYCDDTQPVRFLGLVGNSVTVSVLTGDVQGVRLCDVIRPRYFSMAITGATVQDVGKPVYAKDNQTVQYSQGNFANLVGFVAMFRSATEVLIAAAGPNMLRGTRGLLIGQRTLSAAATIAPGDLNKRFFLGAGTYTITLPALASTVGGDRLSFVSTGAGTMTIAAAGADLIGGSGGSANTTLTTQGSIVNLEADGGATGATQYWWKV